MASSSNVNERKLSFLNALLFETPGGFRFTQDSPILPAVWQCYALEPHKQHELILTVNKNGETGPAAHKLRELIGHLRDKQRQKKVFDPIGQRDRVRVSYIPGQIAVRLYFDEMMRNVLPLTPWWHEMKDTIVDAADRFENDLSLSDRDWQKQFPHPGSGREADLTDALMMMRWEIERARDPNSPKYFHDKYDANRKSYVGMFPAEFSWMVRIAGVVSDCFFSGQPILSDDGNQNNLGVRLNNELAVRARDTAGLATEITTSEERKNELRKTSLSLDYATQSRQEIAASFLQIYNHWDPDDEASKRTDIWRITKNRPIHLAINKSSHTVKADAANRLFDVSCSNITWAILDSGIDQGHPAFRVTSSEYEEEVRREKARRNKKKAANNKDGRANRISVDDLKEHRVKKTLDFTRLRETLDFDIETDPDEEDRRNRIELEIAARLPDKRPLRKDGSQLTKRDEAKEILAELRARIRSGKDINWQDLEPFIVHENPTIPENDHGTHVAGILGADWIADLDNERDLPLAQRTRRMQGVCPDINLIDVRVFRDDGLTDEFELVAAIQFLRWMNSRAGTMRVHGANLSLSLIHEVQRYACGQTPICEECDEATALGMVIVAAAGNRGFEMTTMDQISINDSFKSASITDPGNTESVITVGSTHRKRPHEYGVSYFSSRGPTGDGRSKPDVVAPGEKIKGPTLNGRAEFKDGTSMAAPHVSGVAAMLMARHTELIGQPTRIKEIICTTATDLGRERYFQGSGLVDALRALQFV